jgi:hypothetical protein
MNTLQALLTRGLTLCALLGIGLVAGAEAGTWHVGPAAGPGVDFTDIQSAVDAASEGDTIEIDAGTYLDPVVIDGKSVTLQGFKNAVISSSILTALPQGQLIVRNLAAGQAVHLRNMQVIRLTGSQGDAVLFENNLGRIWAEEFYVTNLEGRAIVIEDSLDVLLTETFATAERAIVDGGGLIEPSAAVFVAGLGHVGIVQSSFKGSSAAPILMPTASVPGGDALVVIGGEVSLDAVTLRGGAGTSVQLGGCLTGASGGRALVLEPAPLMGALVRDRETTYIAGDAGAFDGGCATPPPIAPAIVNPNNVLLPFPGPARKLSMPSLPYPNGAFEFQYEGAPNDVYALFVGKPVPGQQLSFFNGDLWLELATAKLMFIGQASPTGFGGKAMIFTNPGAPITLHVQGFAVDEAGLPWLTTPGTIYFP